MNGAGLPVESLEYSAEVRRRFEQAPGHGRIRAAADQRRHGAAGETGHGVRVEFEMRVRDGLIRECRFRAFGCPHVIAAASWVAEHAEGRAPEDLGWLNPHELAGILAAPPHKLGSLLVVEDAYRACAAGRVEA